VAPHDRYGKTVMRRAAGSRFQSSGPELIVDLGAGAPARIDGTVASEVAVEIESRVSKQIRGAILDLILHKLHKKLLVLMPVHMSNPEKAAAQCRSILGRFMEADKFRVVLLTGSGHNHREEADAALVREALSQLGIESSA
jgi:hypothetical protein